MYRGMDAVNTCGNASDRELLESWSQGHEASFAALVERHTALVRRLCHARLSHADAEDALQAVFIVLAKKPQAARRCPSLEMWLIRVSRYVISSTRRNRERRNRAERGFSAMPTSEPSEYPAGLKHEIHALVDSLPERERTAVTMHYLLGKTFVEAAVLLGRPPDTVSTQVRRGLQRIRRRLGGRGRVVGEAALLTLLSAHGVSAVESGFTSALSGSANDKIIAQQTLWKLSMNNFIAVAGTVALSGALVTLACAIELRGQGDHETKAEHTAVVGGGRHFAENFNAGSSDKISVRSGSWSWLADGGRDGSGCMQAGEGVVSIVLDFPTDKLPLRLSFDIFSDNSFADNYGSVLPNWTESRKSALVRSGRLPAPTLVERKPDWSSCAIYITEEGFAVWENGQLSTYLASQKTENGQIQLTVRRPHFRIDDLSILTITPDNLPDLSKLQKALSAIPDSQRTGTIVLPELSPQGAPPVSVEFLATGGE
jgi:RNA polymerase sigma factor (sigma-70 family)